jgi:hypothetical protein
MDPLDQLVAAAGPMLRRIDEVIGAAGAPADHRMWTELRRVRLLPGAAVHAVAALRPAELTDAATQLRADARAYAVIAESLPSPAGWTGAAADAYEVARRRSIEHLSGGLDSLDERLEATADLAEALVAWIGQSRGELAAALADVLGSTDALVLSVDSAVDPTATVQAQAAADAAERILGTVAEIYELAAELLHGSAELATPLAVP